MEYTHKAYKTECKINNSMHFASERNQAIMSDLISFFWGKERLENIKLLWYLVYPFVYQYQHICLK